MIPSSLKLFGVDAALGGFLLLEQIEGDVAQNGKVFRGLIFANGAMVFVQCDIQNPMQFVLDGPVSAADLQNTLGVAR